MTSAQYVERVARVAGATQEMAARCAVRAAGDYRFLVVNAAVDRALEAVRAANPFEQDRAAAKTSGATDLTSDLDMTIVGEGGELALALANELFAAAYGGHGFQTMSALFDSNLYIQAVLNNHMRDPSFFAAQQDWYWSNASRAVEPLFCEMAITAAKVLRFASARHAAALDWEYVAVGRADPRRAAAFSSLVGLIRSAARDAISVAATYVRAFRVDGIRRDRAPLRADMGFEEARSYLSSAYSSDADAAIRASNEALVRIRAAAIEEMPPMREKFALADEGGAYDPLYYASQDLSNLMSQEAHVSSWAVYSTVLKDQMRSEAPLFMSTAAAIVNMLDQLSDVFKEVAGEDGVLAGLHKSAKYLKRVGQAFLFLDAAPGMSPPGTLYPPPAGLPGTLYPPPGSSGSALWADEHIASEAYRVEYDEVVSNVFGPLFYAGAEMELLKRGRRSSFRQIGMWGAAPAAEKDVFIAAFASNTACVTDLLALRNRTDSPLGLADECSRALRPDFFGRLALAAARAMSRALAVSLEQAGCWDRPHIGEIDDACKPFRGHALPHALRRLHIRRPMDPSVPMRDVVADALQRLKRRRDKSEADFLASIGFVADVRAEPRQTVALVKPDAAVDVRAETQQTLVLVKPDAVRCGLVRRAFFLPNLGPAITTRNTLHLTTVESSADAGRRHRVAVRIGRIFARKRDYCSALARDGRDPLFGPCDKAVLRRTRDVHAVRPRRGHGLEGRGHGCRGPGDYGRRPRRLCDGCRLQRDSRVRLGRECAQGNVALVRALVMAIERIERIQMNSVGAVALGRFHKLKQRVDQIDRFGKDAISYLFQRVVRP